MDDAIKLIVHICCFLVFAEVVWRIFLWFHSNEVPGIIQSGHYAEIWMFGISSFIISFILCVLSESLGLKEMEFVKTNWFRNLLTMMHGSDGLAACIIGTSIYYRSIIGFTIGQLIISKFFLLSLLNRMILGSKKGGKSADFSQTAKSFLHHVASFLFICRPEEIILTTIWRTVSMFGHSLLVLRGRLSSDVLYRFNWILAYARIAFMGFLLIVCAIKPDIRESFGYSAVGHIAYTAVRLAPVFRLGSIYLEEHEKEEWANLSDGQRIRTLLAGKYKWLSLELSLLAFIIVFFASLRATTFVSEISELSKFYSSRFSTLGFNEAFV